MKKLIDKFNNSNVSLVISDYPERDSHGEKNYGIAWYTKETLEEVAKKYNQRFVVLAEKDGKIGPTFYAGGRIMVLRVFDPQHHTLFPVILKWLWKFSNIKKVYVHSEFCTNGGLKNFVLLIPFLGIIKILRRDVTYFAHNVILSFDDISDHLNLGNNKLKISILNISLKFYYRLLGLTADRIVVMDEAIKARLVKFVPEEKLICVPFWIKPIKRMLNRPEARKKLDIRNKEFVLLYFGFITWYKGADWIIDEIQNSEFRIQSRKIRLILAGGEAYSLKDKGYYKKYYQEQIDKVKRSQNITITGFVREEEIEKYFQASDLVVFPYRGLIGSSATLNFAIQYKRPFLISDKMSDALTNDIFAKAFESTSLQEKDIIFPMKKNSFARSLSKRMSKSFMHKLTDLSKFLYNERKINNILDGYFNSIFKVNHREILIAGKDYHGSYQSAV